MKKAVKYACNGDFKTRKSVTEQFYTNKIENAEKRDNFHRKKCNLPKLTQEEIENQRDL